MWETASHRGKKRKKTTPVMGWHALIRLERIIARPRSGRIEEAGKKVYWFIRGYKDRVEESSWSGGRERASQCGNELILLKSVDSHTVDNEYT